MTDTECPYCEHIQAEPDECYEEDVLYEAECDKCEKIYGIKPYYLKGYHEQKMDCKNGGEHDWKKQHTSREGEWQYCSFCEEERAKPEANA